MQNGPWDWKHVADLQDGWDALRPCWGGEIFQLSNIHLLILTQSLFPSKVKKGYFKENMLQIFLSSHKGIKLYNLIGLTSQRVNLLNYLFICVPRICHLVNTSIASVFPVYGKWMNFHDFSITFPSCYCWTKKNNNHVYLGQFTNESLRIFCKKDSLKNKIHNTYISTACKKTVLYTKAMQLSNSMIFPWVWKPWRMRFWEMLILNPVKFNTLTQVHSAENS